MNRKRLISAVALGVLLVAALPAAMAASSVSSSSTSASTSNQNVNIPRENVLGALALGVRGPIGLAAITSGSSNAALQSSRSQNVFLDQNDVLNTIALGRNLGGWNGLGSWNVVGTGGSLGGGWGWSSMLGAVPCSGSSWMSTGWTSSAWPWSAPPLVGWCGSGTGLSMGLGTGGAMGLRPIAIGNLTVYLAPQDVGSRLLAASRVNVNAPVVLGNNTTVAAVLAAMGANNTTRLAPGVTQVMLPNGGSFVLVGVRDQTLRLVR